MEEVALLKLMFALIAVLFVAAMYLKNKNSCSACYIIAFLLLVYSIHVTSILSEKNHTKTFKNTLIIVQVLFALLALGGLINCHMPMTSDNVSNKVTSALPTLSPSDNYEQMMGGKQKVWAGMGTPTLY